MQVAATEGFNWRPHILALGRRKACIWAVMTVEARYARFAAPALADALADTPVVLIHGPRQSGKTTLAMGIAESRGYAHFSFDDAVALGAAMTDPVGFIADLPEHSILDEV